MEETNIEEDDDGFSQEEIRSIVNQDYGWYCCKVYADGRATFNGQKGYHVYAPEDEEPAIFLDKGA